MLLGVESSRSSIVRLLSEPPESRDTNRAVRVSARGNGRQGDRRHVGSQAAIHLDQVTCGNSLPCLTQAADGAPTLAGAAPDAGEINAREGNIAPLLSATATGAATWVIFPTERDGSAIEAVQIGIADWSNPLRPVGSQPARWPQHERPLQGASCSTFSNWCWRAMSLYFPGPQAGPGMADETQPGSCGTVVCGAMRPSMMKSAPMHSGIWRKR